VGVFSNRSDVSMFQLLQTNEQTMDSIALSVIQHLFAEAPNASWADRWNAFLKIICIYFE